jgi:ribosome maturation factor RimP
VSRQLSAAYDQLDDELGHTTPPYTLEVTSPGIGRPLTEPRHFHRARGRLVALTRTDGRSELVRVLGVTDDIIDVLAGGPQGTTAAQIPLDSILRARVEVEFAPPSAAVAAVLAADPRTAAVLAAPPAESDDDPGDDDPEDDVDDDPGDENEEDET